ncbi:MAG: pilus assembly protein [Chloroflexota bacterium]|nr:pilus assembly protein [Chloroflexota bacterium]
MLKLAMRTFRRRVCDQSGASVVLFSVVVPLILLMGVITVDIGNWFVHKRHLQTQVDSAAFAGGTEFTGCFYDPVSANLAIASRALGYAGDTLRLGKQSAGATPSTTNRQVQTPDDVRVVLNANAYWKKGDPTDGSTLDNKLGTPCDMKFLDVKATDDDAPLLWGLIPFTASPKTKARIEIRDLASARGMLPWAVPEIDPKAVFALFVNEDTGAVFDFQELMAADDTALPWSEWITSVGQEQIFLSDGRDNTGVVILISKNDPSPTTTGTLAAICSQDPGLVGCYGGSSATSGLTFIHGYNGTYSGSISSPQVRQVNLFPVGCAVPADYSAPYFTLDGACSAEVQAVIDFGVTGDPRPLAKACATVSGYTWSAGGPDPTLGVWTGNVPLPGDGGRRQVDLDWSAGRREQGGSGNCHNNQPNSDTFVKVAAPYVANTASGPVQYLKLFAAHADGTTVTDPNSVERNDPGNPHYNYSVKVGLPKPNQIGNYTDPPLLLRMASPSGSQNRAWDCDSGRNFREEIESGCQTRYIENYRDVDGDGDKEWNNIACTGWGPGNLPPPTFDGPSPYPSDCVITETGDKTGQLRDGLHDRLETPCYPNRWPDDAAELAEFVGPDGNAYGADPRYVTLIITDDTAFTGSGTDPLPIKYFAGFYVTGWDYHPVQSPGCDDPDGGGPFKANDPHPIYGARGTYTHSRDDGDVWGYFVDLVVFSSEGDPSDELCTFGEDPAACIAVLVE